MRGEVKGRWQIEQAIILQSVATLNIGMDAEEGGTSDGMGRLESARRRGPGAELWKHFIMQKRPIYIYIRLRIIKVFREKSLVS